MRAAVLHGRGDLRVEAAPVPEPAPGEVLLAVGTVGLCGTDASEYLHGPRMFPVEARHPVTGHEGPMTIGHEFSGRVVAAGPGVDPAWVGREVASCGAVSCGRCWQCARGRTNLCISYSGVGLHRPGALAEYVATPLQNCSAVDVLGLPPDAAALGQPMSIAVHARDRGRLSPGERAVVLGAGGIGAFLVHAIAAQGSDVVALDTSAERLALASRLGARAVLDPTRCSTDDVLTELGGPPHVVYEASGRPQGLEFALELLPSGGRLVSVGIQAEPVTLDLRRWTLTELELIGTNAMVRGTDFDEALRLVASRAEGWDDVAPEVVPLEDVAEQLSLLGTGRAAAVKVLVDPRARERRRAATRPARLQEV
jgi:(R,R)-butanediol dehydrogenase / meso-butanediol dehydrogenase / diacetyl reductase